MRGHGNKLTSHFDKAIDALLTTVTLKDAAQKVGVHIQTLQRWLRDDAFNKVYIEAKQALTKHAKAHLMAAQLESVLTLREIQRDKEAQASARVSAARTILELSSSQADFDVLEQQILELRQQVQELQHEPRSFSQAITAPQNGHQWTTHSQGAAARA